jgi:uncharacterized protein
MSIDRTRSLDVLELARSGGVVEGELPLAQLARLSDALAVAEGTLQFRVEGLRDEQGRPCARLTLGAALPLICQRCGLPFLEDMNRTSQFRFVGSEAELDALPLEEDEIDVIAAEHATDLGRWIEDEAILSLPIVPRHPDGDPRCQPAAALAEPEAAREETGKPFAALAALKPRIRTS